jgi:hypothetical protein
MDDARITAEELEAQLQAEVKVLAERMAAAINRARAGRIIADSEEPVREAHAVFRQRAYPLALDLLQNQALQEAFSPSQDPAGPDVEEQGPPEDVVPHRQRPDGVRSHRVLEPRGRHGGAAG